MIGNSYAPNSTENPYQYNGKEIFKDFGFNSYNYGARWYDLAVGRFMEVDPISDQFPHVSTYNYAENEPIANIDLWGLQALRYDLNSQDPNLKNATPEQKKAFYQGFWEAEIVNSLLDEAPIFGEIKAYVEDGFSGLATGLIPFGRKGKQAVEIVDDYADDIVRKAFQEGGSTKKAAKKDISQELNQPTTTKIYKRPNNATTAAQRRSVQGKPCVDCKATGQKNVADHKYPLVKEHYETGTIDTKQMRSVDAVQPQCPSCSSKQGAEMSKYSREMKKIIK